MLDIWNNVDPHLPGDTLLEEDFQERNQAIKHFLSIRYELLFQSPQIRMLKL